MYPYIPAGDQHEVLADMYGPKLWNHSGEFLVELNQNCEFTKDPWYCQKLISWEYGMTH
jgi:hypothetical protein